MPRASAAAWSPNATPTPAPSRILTLDDQNEEPAAAAPEPEPAAEPPPPGPDRLAGLRDIARRLRTAPDAPDTLQFIVETACECTGSDAGMLTVSVPEQRQAVAGTALGAGPYLSLPLRAGGPSFGELVLTRMADADEFETADETFAGLVSEYLAKAVAGMRRGTVLSEEEQDFVDRVAEQLREPVAGAVNLLGAVVGGHASPQEVESYVAAAARDTRRMRDFLDDLIQISRLRAPEPREMESMPVGPWLRRCVDHAQPLAEAAGHRIALRDADAPHVVKGVPAQLDLVVRHLLDNAIKFSEEPGEIEVTSTPVEGMLRVAVADHGIGFDSADAGRMLDCFTRAINAEAARIPGAGVGLFLASEIAKHHGGRLWLESARDEGTRAYVAIPLDA